MVDEFIRPLYPEPRPAHSCPCSHGYGQLQGVGVTDNGTGGGYAFASQTIWQGSSRRANAAADIRKDVRETPSPDQGVVVFAQFGATASRTLPINTFIGGGVSAFGLVPARGDDSFGMGVACSWLNDHIFKRDNELMFQWYYQAKVVDGIFVEPVISYIPTPGAAEGVGAAWALTLRTTVLF